MSRAKLILIVLAISTCCLIQGRQIISAKEKSQEPQKKGSSTVAAYYFHGDFRCSNCYAIEQYSKEAIEKYFSEQLKTGKLTFDVINTDKAENAHYIKDYQLYTKSLVIAEFKDGKQVKWTNLTRVWDYLNDRDAFYKYVKTEIENYLKSL
jgi:hypothetical protein